MHCMYNLFPLGVLFAYNTALQCNIHAKSRDRQGSCFLLETFPSPGDLPDPGIEPTSLASPALADGFLTTESPGKAMSQHPQASRVKPHSGFQHCPWRESTPRGLTQELCFRSSCGSVWGNTDTLKKLVETEGKSTQ